MLAKRIIPCLDIQNGRVAKGICFESVEEIGDPLAMALYYDQMGADELVFYDIHASNEGRETFIQLVESIAKSLTIPFMVGGGIKSIDNIYDCLRAGADKVSINSSAIANPTLLTEGSKRFGAQCIVASMDVRLTPSGYKVFTGGGKIPTDLDAFEWAKRCEALGAGELVINAIHRDGMKSGYDVLLTKTISDSVSIPVIASGGAGSDNDFVQLFEAEAADGALAASIFHYKTLHIPTLKEYLYARGIPVRRHL